MSAKMPGWKIDGSFLFHKSKNVGSIDPDGTIVFSTSWDAIGWEIATQIDFAANEDEAVRYLSERRSA